MGTSNIADKVVVITGASSGIGESTAKLLARQGAKVVLGARRKNRIDAVVEEISAAGGKAIGFAVDVTKRAEVEAFIKGAVDNFGRVDVMVNNAGIMAIAPMAALKVEEWDRMIDVNLKGLLYGVAAVAADHAKAKAGSHHQHGLRFRDQSVCARRNCLLWYEVRCPCVDGRTPVGTTFPKHPLHNDLAWRCCLGASRRQLGGSDKKEFARVLQDGYSG